MKHLLVSAVTGLFFGAGLVISGMADPAKVLAFLTLNRHWDPSLAIVMASALAVAVPGFAWLRRRAKSFLGGAFAEPARSDVDRKLVLGATLFGLGWGLSGYCPGPALVSAGLGQPDALLLLAAMVLGAWMARRAWL